MDEKGGIEKISLPKVEGMELTGRSVLVRADLEWGDKNCPRERATREMVRYLQEKGAERIKVIGHKGEISMVEKLGVDMNFDLRRDAREEANEESLAEELASGFDAYVNEAFATSHRKHCSIDAVPRFLKKQGKQVGVGLRFAKEVESLERFSLSSGIRRVLVVGGAKSEDKEKCAEELEKKGWTVLRGGLLPGAELREDGLDISTETVANYKSQIASAKIIVVAGPMGKWEDKGAAKGTEEVLTAIAQSKAVKIAGGGDTEAAIAKFGLGEKFDWISVGGGAMLEFLAKGTLPGIEALL